VRIVGKLPKPLSDGINILEKRIRQAEKYYHNARKDKSWCKVASTESTTTQTQTNNTSYNNGICKQLKEEAKRKYSKSAV